MLVAGGGGGGGGTPWYSYQLPQMWNIINDQDVDALWQQASAWKKATDLTAIHQSNLQEYKDQLAEAWPPERSEASAAYMAELDKLIASVKETNEAASRNYTAVVNLALAVGDAKYKLKPLYDEYKQNESKLAQYQKDLADYNDDNFVQHIFESKPDKPVADGRQEQLNSQARTIMYRISGEVTTAGATMTPPKPYARPAPKTTRSDGNQETGGGGGGGGTPLLVPPVIPPVTQPPPSPLPPPGTQPGFDPPTTKPPVTGIGEGPILGGTPTPTPAPPRPGPIIEPIPTPPPPPPIQPMPVPPPIVGPTPPPGGGGPPYTGVPPKTGLPNTGLIKGLGIGPEGPGNYPRGPGARPMPPGGVIGERPLTGMGRTGAAGRPLSRVNPPGGMIGGEPVGGAAAGRPGAAAGRPGAAARPGGAMAPGGSRASGRAMGMPGSRSGRRGADDQEMQHWDPDNPWETEEGVAPVVLPPDEPGRHDPGPAIGQGR